MSVIVNPTASVTIGGAIVGGTPPAILFIGAGSVLAQDPTNFGYNVTNNILLLQGQNAIYRVPNVSGDNWFEAGAGNVGVTGSSNFGTGEGSLINLTNGFNNTAIGSQALKLISSGSNNVGIGNGALFAVTTGVGNFAIGTNAGGNITTGGSNFAVGNNALQFATTSVGNTAVGNSGLVGLTSGDGNTAIGLSSSLSLTSGNFNIGIGDSAMRSATSGDGNTFIGTNSGFSMTSAAGSTILGFRAGQNFTGATRSVLLGSWPGSAIAITDIIALSTGDSGSAGVLRLDYNYTTSNIWTHQNSTTAQGLHVYNTTDSGAPPTNYERAALSWIDTANIFRIESQAGGTGTVRIIAIDGFQKAGAPAAGDIPAGTWGLINDTSGNATWLAYNNAGTIRKVQLV